MSYTLAVGAVLLIVDDEEPIRRLVKTILCEYNVLLASDGVEAYQTFQQMGGAVDLVLTDLFMPRMDGNELAAKLQSQKPGLPILFMSGIAADAPGTGTFIRKPFTATRLTEAVQDALSRNSHTDQNDEDGAA